jgi:hypothetical protein
MVKTWRGTKPPPARRIGRFAAVVGLGLAVGTAGSVVVMTPAVAAPQTPHFGRSIDGYAGYDGQDTCDPTAKPGVTATRNLLNAAYGSHTTYIPRDCATGGTSEHKEGRALDYMLDHNDASERAIAEEILDWLLATDVYGNKHANARRLGVMYLIWNRRIWESYTQTWSDYSGSNPHTDHIHISFSWAGARQQTSWWDGGTNMSVYGTLSDGRLTYTSIESGTGDRLKTVVSTATLGFVPKAMATLNFNTLLITSTAGQLYRVDVISNNTSLTYEEPVLLDGGWTHDLLTFDGDGHLFGIAGGTLRRYTITSTKPATSNITANTVIGGGFVLDTLAASGPNWIIGTSEGRLRSYKITGADSWDGYPLIESGWGGFTHLISPGAGLYLGRTSAGGMYHYYDVSPFDGRGDDITYYNNDPVDTSGWTQTLISAQPFTT